MTLDDAPFIDTLSPAYDADIHAAHRAARERSWLARTPYGFLLLRYEDVHWCLRDARFHELGAGALAQAGIAGGPLHDWFHSILSNKEGEEHARLRRLVAKAFTPRQVERLRPVMRATANEFLDRVAPAGRSEVVADFAAPYPVRVIGSLLGVPPDDYARFHAWSTDLSLAFGSKLASELPRIERALGNLLDYTDGLIERQRREPGEDLTTALIAARDEGDRLSPEELRAMITVLIFGGQDTTQCQLACAIATFLAHPDAWRRVAREPALAASAAEEVLRYEPAGSGSPRIATCDVERHGVVLPAGTVVHPSGPAANRDPRVYADPDRFDVERAHPQPMLTFGGGAHYCLGASLARAEIQEALPILARRLPALAPDGEAVWRTGALIRGPERLPVRFAPSAAGAH
ncbi:MAG: cytochrome P450 [Myxococcota bacterium]|nr:cytochrome P450 [Myxococcales bacterium]